jgi:protein-tyrosine phosphatase
VAVVSSLAAILRRGCAAAATLAVVLTAGCTPTLTPLTPLPTSAAPTTSSATVSPSTTATPSTPTSTPTAKPLKITSVVNFRDVAGDGLELAGGGRMATGVVYRSAQLTGLSAADEKTLVKAGLAVVIDLRTEAVAARRPDPAITGAKHYLVNVLAAPKFPSLWASKVGVARANMRKLNTDFVDSAGRRAKIGRVLELIAAADGQVLIHCTEGKDRTGWLSAVLQLTAGASRQQVLSEYVKTNVYRAAQIDAEYRARLKSSGLKAAQVQLALSKVESGYLGAGLDELKVRYGSISGYLTKGLGLSAATVHKLRDRLTA